LEGEVSFGDGINDILTGAMEGATAVKDEPPTKFKVAKEDLPQWQNDTDPAWELSLTPDRTGKQPVNQPMKVSIQVMNTKTKDSENSYNNEVQVSVDSDLLFVSNDGSSWSNTANVTIKDGKGTLHVKGGDEGKSSIITTADDSESSKLQFEFYISKSQKRSMGGKLSELANKKGLSGIADVISGKSLQSTSVVAGSANIDDVLQKVDTGELEILDKVIETKSDGSVTIKLIIRPRKQDNN